MSRDLIIRGSAWVVTFTAVAGLAITTAAGASPALRRAIGLARASAPAYEAGRRLDVPASATSAAPFALVLFASAECGACQRGKATLTNIVQAARALPGVSVRMVSSDAWPESERQYGAGLGLESDQVTLTDLTKLRVARVPTLVLTDQSGVVVRSWEGVPSDVSDVVRGLTSLTMGRASRP